jgi:hypothetical protein
MEQPIKKPVEKPIEKPKIDKEKIKQLDADKKKALEEKKIVKK